MYVHRIMGIVVLASLVAGCGALSTGDVRIEKARTRAGGESNQKVDVDEKGAIALAEAVLPFAKLSKFAYCAQLRRSGVDSDDCQEYNHLQERGWTRLFDSKDVLTVEEAQTRLTFVAFRRVDPTTPSRADIVFAFRGTIFRYASDWRANLRWLTRFFPGTDQYEVLYSRAPEMIDRAMAAVRQAHPGVNEWRVYATGHSLGGGLAQLFGYADRRVHAVVTFDPSPVTGYFNVVKDDRVNCKVNVLRVYERQEILQYVRSIMRRLYTPTENVLEVEFDLMQGGFNPIANHSIAAFTDRMERGLSTLKADVGVAEVQPQPSHRQVGYFTALPADSVCIRDRLQTQPVAALSAPAAP